MQKKLIFKLLVQLPMVCGLNKSKLPTKSVLHFSSELTFIPSVL